MAYKVTLSIPDFLHEKLEEWRNSFNLSKMFQETLTEAIQKKEAFKKRFSEDFELPEIIKRLKHEKFLWEKKFYSNGREEGLKWAKTAGYEDLLYVLHIKDAYKLIADPRLNDYFKQIYQSTKMSRYNELNSVDHEQLFIDGWLKGVRDFWNLIKEKL